MTITFYCPYCDNLVAFDSKHSGKQAKCLNCGQLFIIPPKDYQKPLKVKPPVEKITTPKPQFYRAVFVDSWKIFIDPANTTTLAFVAALVLSKFFLSGACCAHIANFIIIGWLCGFYLNLIHQAAFDQDDLPHIYLGTSTTFAWNIIKPMAIFLYTLMLVWLPVFICLVIFRNSELTFDNLFHSENPWRFLIQGFFILGLFIFPMAILTMAIGKSLTLMRPDYLLAPVIRAFLPYLVTVFLLAATILIESQTRQVDFSRDATLWLNIAQIGLNLTVQAAVIIAMRSIGLFYRHHVCFLKW